MQSIRETLISARKLIEREENWFHGDRDSSVTFCCSTAVSKAIGKFDWPREKEALEFLAAHIPAGSDADESYLSRIWNWNDAEDRKHSEVLAVYDRAIADAA